jgi:hypothetical protein
MIPARGYDLEQRLTFRLTQEEMQQIANYARTIEAPVSYAVRTLLRTALQKTEQQAA